MKCGGKMTVRYNALIKGSCMYEKHWDREFQEQTVD